MVSRSFLVTQACLNAIQERMPQSVLIHGAAATWRWAYSLFQDGEVPRHWMKDVRKHFSILDRREREAADVVRLDTWREAAGLK